jgi:hypothetical protein
VPFIERDSVGAADGETSALVLLRVSESALVETPFDLVLDCDAVPCVFDRVPVADHERSVAFVEEKKADRLFVSVVVPSPLVRD